MHRKLTYTSKVDWPYTPFLGRDGSTSPATDAPQCAVLDRLPHFQYRIRTDAPFVPSGVKTTEPPGACHMGRSAARPPVAGCWMVEDNSTTVVMRCPGGSTQIVPKSQIKTPFEMVNENMLRRQRCASSCSAPPAFKAPDGTTNMPIPEVGYGRPFRWEMARMLAGEYIFFYSVRGRFWPTWGWFKNESTTLFPASSLMLFHRPKISWGLTVSNLKRPLLCLLMT